MDDVPPQESRRDVAARRPASTVESAAMAVNIIGLGLLVAGVIFMIMGGLVGWIIGVICVIGGVGALFLTWQRKRRATA